MSLRARLLAGMALVAGVLAVAAVIVTRSTEAHLVDQVDAQLGAAANGPGPRLGGAPPRPPAADDGSGAEVFSDLYLARVTADGRVQGLARPNLSGEDQPLPALDADRVLAAAADHEPFTVGSAGSEVRYRVVARAAPDGDGAVVAAMSLADVDAAVSRLVLVEVVAVAGVVAVLGLVTWWVVRLGVRPLKTMTVAARDIAAGDLSRRVPTVAPGTEAGELGAALNVMLARIEDEFDERVRTEGRLRQFAADASHELRTPVATTRGYAELYRTGALGDEHQVADAMRRIEEEAIRMGALVDDLLHLARLDQGQPLEHRPVDLTHLADDAAQDATAIEPARPVHVESVGPVVVAGDEARLRQVLANLVGNALVHTPAGTPVAIRTARAGDRGVVEVADAGPGMTREAADRAFERFYRADPARSRHHGGAGLGLAIVEATMRAHGGTAALTSDPRAGTTVRVELPLASTAHRPATEDAAEDVAEDVASPRSSPPAAPGPRAAVRS